MIKPNQGIGIFGGSFDPIHVGHTLSALSVAKELNLSQVLIVPAYVSPLKTSTNLLPHANSSHRIEMAKIACEHSTLFSCDSREIDRSGPSYTVETLKEFKTQYPGQTLYFIIGMDSLLSFTRWHKYQEILSLCHLVVNSRPQHDLTQLNEKTQTLLDKHLVKDKTALLHKTSGNIYLAKPVSYDISSTEIRQKISQQKPCLGLLDAKIAEYIDKNKLYR